MHLVDLFLPSFGELRVEHVANLIVDGIQELLGITHLLDSLL